MISDAWFTSLLRDAREHQRDVEQLIATLERLTGSATTVRDVEHIRRLAPGGRTVAARAPTRTRRPKPTPSASLAVNGTTTNAIRNLLASDGPLRTADVHDRLVARGWTTKGKDPRAVIGATLTLLVNKGDLRRVGTNGHSAFALTSTPAAALKKVEAAAARAAATPKRGRPNTGRTATRAAKRAAAPKPPKAPQRRIRTDVPLTSLIRGELANSNGLTRAKLVERCIAAGWRTSSPEPGSIVRLALRDLGDAVVYTATDDPRDPLITLRDQPTPAPRRTRSTATAAPTGAPVQE
jgi:hypothetical protein